MSRRRKVARAFESSPTIEGAGVHLRRAFGPSEVPEFDPFLMLDDFRGTDPAQYSAGFPWHPHRGIETVTYVLEGTVTHGDSMGNRGTIGPGDVQWMTAGSGIIHEEMPGGDERGHMGGFQLWANLPETHKMIEPRYCDVSSAQIPEAEGDGACIRVICGRVADVEGPVRDIVTSPTYLDVTIGPDTKWSIPAPEERTLIAYVFQGRVFFDDDRPAFGDGTVVLFGRGDVLRASTQEEGARFLLLSGKPLREPIAWRGPIVMTTEEDLRKAFAEYRDGTFVKHAKPKS